MKKLILLFMLVLVFLVAAPVCSAQSNPTFPYVFTGTPLTCAPMSSCLNYVYIPVGWYGSIYENGSIQCFTYPGWAAGYRLNLLVQIADSCTHTNTLLEAYLGTNSRFYYAPGNPFAVNNILYAAQLMGTGAVYAILNNSSYLLGAEYLYQDCYTGSETESGGNGGIC